MIKLFVFDFDGTLTDTKQLAVKVIGKSLNEADYDVSHLFLENHLGLAPLHTTLSLLGIKDESLAHLVSNIYQMFESNIENIKPVKSFNYIGDVKVKKLILSNNSTNFIEEVLKSWNCDFFDEVYGAEKLESKYERFENILDKYKIKAKEVIYIGDMVTDVKLAKEVGCISVAISHPASWSSKKDILNAKPDHIITSFKDLNKIIKNIK